MAGDSIFYEKDGDEFVLVHQRHDLREDAKDILFRGREVAIGFSYDPDQAKQIQYTTHRHGSPETVNKWAKRTREALLKSEIGQRARERGETAAAILRSMLPHSISSDQWDIDDLNRIINTTGYLAVVVEKMGIKISEEDVYGS